MILLALTMSITTFNTSALARDSLEDARPYAALARTGGAEGLRRSLAMRDSSRSIDLEQLMDLAKIPLVAPSSNQHHLGAHLLARSGEWGLVRSWVLGDDDWFIVRIRNGHWSKPMFTGITEPEDAAAARRLLQGKWLDEFVGSKTVLKDTDRDGLNDLAEHRLGTDPKRPDTDGDGLVDAVDKNPLAAPRVLTQEEQVRWAAFECSFHFEKETTPVFVDCGTKPFELSGCRGFVLPHRVRPAKSMSFDPAPSVGFFFLPKRKLGLDLDPTVPSQPCIDRVIDVDISYGSESGYALRVWLHKFGKTWVAIGIDQLYVV